jgi:hypothetical protein
MNGQEPEYVEALIEENGIISAMGSYDEMKQLLNKYILYDLEGKTLLPGFIDSHGHFLYYGRISMDVNLSTAKSINDIINIMKNHKYDGSGWLVGFGFDQNTFINGKTELTSDDLDKISTNVPIYVGHKSGHQGCFNSYLLKEFQKKEIQAKSIRKGYYVEEDLFKLLQERPALSKDKIRIMVKNASRAWLRNGQTTASECGAGMFADDFENINIICKQNLLPIDLIIYAKAVHMDKAIEMENKIINLVKNDKLIKIKRPLDDEYVNGARLAGIKYWLDGDLLNGYMSEPFEINPLAPESKELYYGQPTYTTKELINNVSKYFGTKYQINMHMIGDAAVDQALTTLSFGNSDRPIFTHAPNLRDDQFDKIKECDAIPSLLMIGAYRGADPAVKFIGMERAKRMNPAKELINAGITFTISHDCPVTPEPVVLPAIWQAATRISQNGNIFDEQKIDVYNALKAVTINAAYQFHEEKIKGSLEIGKIADFVILDKNPLKCPLMDIKDIVVMATIKGGKMLYKRNRMPIVEY